MRRVALVLVISLALVSVTTAPVFAYHCPALVKECQTTADVVTKREGSDKSAAEKARKGCEEAMKLHQDGKHKESMVKAGEAIADASRALK